MAQEAKKLEILGRYPWDEEIWRRALQELAARHPSARDASAPESNEDETNESDKSPRLHHKRRNASKIRYGRNKRAKWVLNKFFGHEVAPSKYGYAQIWDEVSDTSGKHQVEGMCRTEPPWPTRHVEKVIFETEAGEARYDLHQLASLWDRPRTPGQQT